jgi:uncharacterized glyoxalase superfamily protein PhnB
MRFSLMLAVVCSCACGVPGLSPYPNCQSQTPPPIDKPGVDYRGLVAELLVPDVDTGVAYYRDQLGFDVIRNDATDHSCFAAVQFEDDVLLINHVKGTFTPMKDNIELRFLVSDVDASYATMKAAGAAFVRDIATAEYGLREYVVRDPYGARLRFAMPIP